jgi:2,3-bisphosphoglycerate-independent phosphoglycerate mutase
MSIKPIVLIIMDGYGISSHKEGNAVAAAKKPYLDKYFKNYPKTTLEASGKNVGLLKGQMGNSEVGHLNIGAGRIVPQDSLRISEDINKGGIYKNKELLKITNYCRENNKDLHLLGLLSDGGVHSLDNHLYSLLKLCKKEKLKKVYIHCFLDGRDTPPKSASKYLKRLSKEINKNEIAKIATIMGRYYAMDRDSSWDRTKKAYEALILSEGHKVSSFQQALNYSYKKEVYDEFLEPCIITKNDEAIAKIKDGDGLIFFNFRGDRSRQLSAALTKEDFSNFKRKKKLNSLRSASLTEYDKSLKNIKTAYKPISIKNTFSEFVSKENFNQLKIAETTKYAHVTFFFNGGVEEPYKNETRILVPSPEVKTFDLKPEMSAKEITKQVIREIKLNKHDFIIMNYANPDMVGHSAKMKPTKKAVEVVDECVGLVSEEVLKQGGVSIITADHGNAEELIDLETKKAKTSHTNNPVPFCLISLKEKVNLKKGILADIIPTMLDIAKIKKPPEMTGESLIKK